MKIENQTASIKITIDLTFDEVKKTREGLTKTTKFLIDGEITPEAAKEIISLNNKLLNLFNKIGV